MRFALVLSALGTGAMAQMAMVSMLLNKLDQTPEGQCHQLSAFTAITDAAKNPQIVDALTGGNTTKAQMAQVIISVLDEKMAPIKANQATVDGCKDTIATDNKVIDCLQTQQMNKLNAIIANQTAFDAMTQGNPQRQDMLKKLSAALDPKVKAVNANADESGFCKSSVDGRCIMQKIQTRFVELASDDAALNAHFMNNATMVEKFKAGAAKAQAKLDAQKADKTLVDVCAKMPNVLPVNPNDIKLEDLPTGNGGMQNMHMML